MAPRKWGHGNVGWVKPTRKELLTTRGLLTSDTTQNICTGSVRRLYAIWLRQTAVLQGIYRWRLRFAPYTPLMADVLTFTDRGIYCPAGDFYIDP